MKVVPNYHPPSDYRRPTKTQEREQVAMGASWLYLAPKVHVLGNIGWMAILLPFKHALNPSKSTKQVLKGDGNKRKSSKDSSPSPIHTTAKYKVKHKATTKKIEDKIQFEEKVHIHSSLENKRFLNPGENLETPLLPQNSQAISLRLQFGDFQNKLQFSLERFRPKLV